MIGDFYGQKWPREYDWIQRPEVTIPYNVSRSEFEALRKEVLDMKELLKRAKAYDEKNNEPHCEMEGKVALLRKVARLVGVDLGDVLQRANSP